MELKYICKNDGYIIDRKFMQEELEEGTTFKTKGRMTLTENLPENEEMKKDVIEYAFDSMKDDVIKTFKKKYYLKDEELVNFYFEGNIENSDEVAKYVQFENQEIPVIETNFNLNFEVELKITSKNFLKVQYDNMKYRFRSAS